MISKRQKDYLRNTDEICKALAIILENKNVSEITINEICDMAKINRTTFYAHYENIYDALNDVMNVLKRFIMEMIKQCHVDILPNTKNKTIEEIEWHNRKRYLPYFLNYVREEKLFFKSILKKNELYDFNEINVQLYLIFFKDYFDCLNVEEKIRTKLFRFYLFGAVSLIYEWLENDCKDSIEEVIDSIYECISFDFK